MNDQIISKDIYKITPNEIQYAIKEIRDNDLKIEALKHLKESEHTIKDKLDEINIENIFKITTNIYR